MNNLNSNIGNKNNTTFSLNNKGSSRKKFTGDMGNVVLICLIALGVLVLVFVGIIISIYIKTYNQNKIQNHVEEELLKYIHDCKDNPTEILGTKIPSSTLANEYSLNFWIYVNGLEFRNDFNKQVLMKGISSETTYKNEIYTQANPGIFIKKNTNDMVLTFEGEDNFTDLTGGCFRVFDIIDKMRIKIKHTVGSNIFINRNTTGNGLQQVTKPNPASHDEKSFFYLKHHDIIARDGKKIRRFKIYIKFTDGTTTVDKYIKKHPTSTNYTLNLVSDGAAGTIFEIETANEDNHHYKIKFKDGSSFRYLNYNSSDNIYELLPTSADFIFQFDINSGVQVQKYISNLTGGTPYIETDKETESKCKNRLKGNTAGYTHIGMTRRSITEENTLSKGFCKPLENIDIPTLSNVGRDNCVTDTNKPEDYIYGKEGYMYVQPIQGAKTGEVTIKNIPVQRWTCFNVSVHDRIVDIYKDGLLHHTEVLANPPKINDYNIILGNNGGFDGYLSRITWSNKALSPGEIYDKYKQGPRISKTLTDRITGIFKKD